jgi:hypothetical protein
MVIALAGNVIALVLGRQQQMLFRKNELRPEKWTPLSRNHLILIGCGGVRG